MTKLSLLLNAVWRNNYSLLEAKRRFAHQLTPDFRLFDLVHVDEMRLSNFIAFLLCPKETHAQGTLYLELFLDIIGKPKWLKQSDLKNCQVTTEKQANGQRRIDIYLQFSNGVIGIENKPWACDQKNQLSDYADYLSQLHQNERRENWLLIYLCNDNPSKESISDEKRESLEQSKHLAYVSFYQLAECLEYARDKTYPINLRVMLEELLKFIRFNVNRELDMTIKNETMQIILETDDNLESAFDVNKTLNSVKYSLVKKLELQLNEKIKNTNPNWSLDMGITESFARYQGFSIKFSDSSNVVLRFEFDNASLRNLFWGIRRETQNIKDQDKWIEIKNILDRTYTKQFSSDWWPWYSSNMHVITHDIDIKNWDNNVLPWKMIKNDEFADKVLEVANQVYKAFEGRLDLLECKTIY